MQGFSLGELDIVACAVGRKQAKHGLAPHRVLGVHAVEHGLCVGLQFACFLADDRVVQQLRVLAVQAPASEEGTPVDNGAEVGDGQVFEDVNAGLPRGRAVGRVKHPAF